jgi:NitT/TauT family transport system permease protein
MSTGPRTPTRAARRSQSLIGAASLLAGLLAWWVAARLAGLPAFILPSPEAVWSRFLTAVGDGTLALHTGRLAEILLAQEWALRDSHRIRGDKSRFLADLSSTGRQQAVPLVAIAPLLVIWFGPGMFSKVLICGMIVFFPVVVNTIVGVRAVPLALHDLMRSLHARREQILLKLEIPAALPVFLGGLRIGATLSVIGAVVGELVGSDRGLGFLINVGRGQYDTALVFVAVFVLIALALCLYGIVAWLEARTLLWQEWRKE